MKYSEVILSSRPKQLLTAITERKHKPKVIKFNPALMEAHVQGRGAAARPAEDLTSALMLISLRPSPCLLTFSPSVSQGTCSDHVYWISSGIVLTFLKHSSFPLQTQTPLPRSSFHTYFQTLFFFFWKARRNPCQHFISWNFTRYFHYTDSILFFRSA